MSTNSVAATNLASTSNAVTSTSKSQSAQKMDMNGFLTMFTTQLQHQDPSNPLQSYELAAQLAQFSTVSELGQINKTLTEQQTNLSSITNYQMIGAIGKEVVGQDDTIQLTDGQISKGAYTLDAPATAVTVKITDSEGNVVRTMPLEGGQEAGSYNLSWDGLDDYGEAAANGAYHFDVEAVGEDGQAMEVQKTISNTVTAFRMESGVPYLILGGTNGIKLPVSAITEIHDSPQAYS